HIVESEGPPSNTASVVTSPAPLSSFIADKVTGEPPLSVQFDASASSSSQAAGITDYNWDFNGDGEFDLNTSEAQTSHTFTESGTFDVLLRVTDASGLYGESSQIVIVNQPPTAFLSVSPKVGASPLLVNLDGSSSRDTDGDIVSYEWDFDG